MQFSIAAIAFLATAVLAHESAPVAESTAFSTVEVTITSCAPTVTNCPARSTVTTHKVVPTSVAQSNGTTPSKPSHSKPAHPSKPASSPAGVAVPTGPAECAPQVIYSTVTVTAGASKSAIAPAHPTGIKTVPAGAAAPSGTTGPKNVTAPTTLPFTAGASGLQGSVAFAAVAGVVAFLFV